MGHIAGDKCLQQIGQLLQSLASRSGELAARYGGEEFVLLFPEMDQHFAEQQAQRLVARMAELAIPDADGNAMTFIVGIAVMPPTLGTTVGQLLRQADIALYKAKDNGRDRYEFYDDSMRGESNVAKKSTSN